MADVNIKTGLTHGIGPHPDDGGVGKGASGEGGPHGPQDSGDGRSGQTQDAGHRSSRVGELNTRTQNLINKIKSPNPSSQNKNKTGNESSQNTPTQHSHPSQGPEGHPGKGPHGPDGPHGQTEDHWRPGHPDGHGLQDQAATQEHGNGHAYGRGWNARADGHEWNGDGHGSATGSAALKYLRGTTDGIDLPQGLRNKLDLVTGVVGRDALDHLFAQRGDKVEKIFSNFLKQASQSNKGFAENNSQHADALRSGVNELLSALQLSKHFSHLEKSGGGETVGRAEEAVLRFLMGDADAHGRLHAAELLRDLRAGAFFPAHEADNPFPLTGRARVVSEMIELLHTLDAIERAINEPSSGGIFGTATAEGAEIEAALIRLAGGVEAGLEELAGLLPALPGRAARYELVRMLALLKGQLVDAQGKTLTSKEGLPLKLDQLLWLGTTGSLLGSAFKGGDVPTHLSPVIIFGFDAVYSLIGFDGRTLASPHFAAIQAQVNGSELEWIFGQPPFSEGWMRALIERLKDSISPDHNLLGEMLEEALTGGRFHAVLVEGTVSAGEPVSGTFNIKQLLPASAESEAFAPA